MPKFCPECATALDADAKFCPSCRARVGVAAALGSEIRAEMTARVRAVAAAPGMSVPPPIWAGVIEIFGCFVGAGNFMVAVAGGGAAFAGAGVAGLMGGSSNIERVAVWLGLNALFYLALLSFQLPLIFGFLALKRWAYGLYMWSIGPLVLAALGLKMTQPALAAEVEKAVPLGLSIAVWIAYIAAIALLGTQVWLVTRSKEHLVN